MKAYRIKHVPSGLYYRPAAGGYRKKSNLSTHGKIYKRKPSIKGYIGGGFRHDFKDGSGYNPYT